MNNERDRTYRIVQFNVYEAVLTRRRIVRMPDRYPQEGMIGGYREHPWARGNPDPDAQRGQRSDPDHANDCLFAVSKGGHSNVVI
jgi:hypothetical protein